MKLQNTGVFLGVWRKIQEEAVYKQHDWTVKADADTVFFPERLRWHISAVRPPFEEPAYLHNLRFGSHFLGALQVISRGAVDALLADLDSCAEHLHGVNEEDQFLGQCLDALSVGHIEDFSLLNDKLAYPKGWNLFDVSPCTDPTIVAFHPYKHVPSWLGCHKLSMHQQLPGDFVACEYRWDGDACFQTSARRHPEADSTQKGGILFH